MYFSDGSGNQRWAFNRHNDENFVSRYDRMTDAGNDYSVFTSNLPGIPTLLSRSCFKNNKIVCRQTKTIQVRKKKLVQFELSH